MIRMINIKKEKGFTLVEFLIIVSVIGFLSIFMSWSGARAATSAKVTSMIRSLVDCRRALISRYSENPEKLYYNNLAKGRNHVKTHNSDGAYLTETFSDVVEEDGKKITRLYIEYDSPDIKLDKKISRGLMQYARSLRLYKSCDDLSDKNLISGDAIKTPFYMFVQEIPIK